MQSHAKRALKLAAFLVVIAVGFAAADVKLRVYLKDGSLQAGNLVSETKDAFVILTKEGRQEISKTNIMFVNGKTLAQWEARPDKNYSTEILPSEVPNPSFINNKAALPPPVALPVERKPITPPAAVSKPVEEAKPVEPEPVKELVKEKAVAPAPAPVVKKAPEPAIVKREAPVQPAAAPVVEEKPAVVAAKPTRRKHVREKPVAEEKAAAPIAETPVEPKRVLPPRFDRMSYATYHYNLGMELLAGGQRGRATQEFHFANTLNKWDEKTALELGNFYKEEGVFSRARKYFDLPALRKKPEIQQIQKDMADAEKQAERHRWIVFGGAAAGALLCVPALMILRRYHKKPAPLVVTSENIDEIAEQAAAEEVAAAVAEALAVDIPEPEPEEEKPFVPPPPPPPVEKLRAQPIRPLPVRPEPVQFEVVREAVEPPAPPPVIIPVPPAPEPVSVASTTAPIIEERIRERERVLEVGKVVSEALSKGHVLAGEGNIELARREYRTAAALDGQCLDAELGLAYLCFIQDQWELAMQHYVRALAINPDSPEAHYGVGRVLFETEQIDAAVPEFRKSLELDPTFQDARDALSLIEKVA